VRSFRKLALITTAATVLLITIGGLVRASGSGLGCPDWPKCHGSWIPPLQAHALIEYSHRLTAAIVGGLILVTAFIAWLRFRSNRAIFWPALGALGVVLVQGGVGRVVVEKELSSHLVALHFGISLTMLALLVILTVNAYLPGPGRFGSTARLALVSATAIGAVLMLGAFVTQWNAALVFPDWPLMGGSLLPPLSQTTAIIHYLHRAAALLIGFLLAYNVFRFRRSHPEGSSVRTLAAATFFMWFAQVLVGAANVWTRSKPWAVAVHVLLGSLVWMSAVALAVAAYRTSRRRDSQNLPERTALETPALESTGLEKVKAYFALTKPRIIELLLITTVPAMILAARGWPPVALVLATLLGGSLMAGAANAINCFLDRDIDSLMDRTSVRPLPRGTVEPAAALRFGIALAVIGFVWFVATVNIAAALLALGALLFYVFVYTIWLKRSTTSNIVIGGAAGAVPVLVGWAAVTGRVSVQAAALFGVVFYWTPPHFWALALRYRSDYGSAGVPMLPVVRGAEETVKQMLLYTVATVALSLLVFSSGLMGVVFLAASMVLGAVFLTAMVYLAANPDQRRAMTVFRTSILYLSALFILLAADVLVGAPELSALYGPVATTAAAVFVGSNLGIFWRELRHRSRARLALHRAAET
jgi:heme o synthase